MREKFGEILPPASNAGQQLEVSQIRPPQVGGLLSKWLYHFQAQTVRKQQELFHSLVGLMAAQEEAIRAKVSLERTVVSLEFLDDYRQLEREKIRAEIEWERARLRIKDDEILAELATSAANLHKAREIAEKVMNAAPPEKTVRTDPVSEQIRSSLHGGKYTREAEADIEQFIKDKGGEGNLTEEDRERIRNTRLRATKADLGKG